MLRTIILNLNFSSKLKEKVINIKLLFCLILLNAVQRNSICVRSDQQEDTLTTIFPLQVGSWSAMTGYGLAFPVNSKQRNKFNEMLLEYRENGDLERLSRYWLHGVCKPNMQEKRASEPLSIDQFLSAFLLLILGEIA